MNIFVLDTDPAIAASYHCDQHLHKMILESAQMLSTVLMEKAPAHRNTLSLMLYRPTHPNHPCTLWLKQSTFNCGWLIRLCEALDTIRQDLGCDEHASMKIIRIIKNWLYPNNIQPEKFIFAGPPSIEIRNLSVVEKYQMYYRQKHKQWTLDKAAGMSYKNRPIPPFLQDLF